MNKAQRLVYRELSSELDFTLCAFCKFSECMTGYSPCDVGEPECKHPLADRLEDQWGSYMYGIDVGQDCWGFRPAHPVDLCADLTGICLANGWDCVVWWQNKRGQWRIAKVEVY